jgi:ABC-2 type transport system permease protein
MAAPDPLAYLGILAGLTLVFFAGGAAALPRTD